jgi:hypothetical protein
MMTDSAGCLAIPDISVKEQLHMFPCDFTNVTDISIRKRHSMLGNSWHIGLAVFMLSAILSSAKGPVL